MNNTAEPNQPGPIAAHPATQLAARIAAIIASITGLVFRHSPHFGDLAIPLHNRIAGVARRITVLLARLAAGRLPRPHTPRPGRKGSLRPIRFSRRQAWLVHQMGHHAAAYSSQLQHLLHEPATAALLAQADPRSLAGIARTLRPLCRMLGIVLPPALQPPPAPRRIRPPRPPRPTPPPLRSPLYPRRFARDMPPLYPSLDRKRP